MKALVRKMKILDMTAGNRAIWYDKKNPLATFIDKRQSVDPDICCDNTMMPFKNNTFHLIVYDPPHMNCGPNSNMSKQYGHHTTKEILDNIERAGKEAHRVAKKNCLMALKWNDHDIKLQRVLDLLNRWEPLFGHLTKDGPGSKTYWSMLRVRK